MFSIPDGLLADVSIALAALLFLIVLQLLRRKVVYRAIRPAIITSLAESGLSAEELLGYLSKDGELETILTALLEDSSLRADLRLELDAVESTQASQ